MVRGNTNFTPKATKDFRSIIAWYNNQGYDLADSFLLAFDKALNKIQRNPTICTYINKKVRRRKTAKFPYYIYFSYLNGITVLRIRHTKQQPLKRFT